VSDGARILVIDDDEDFLDLARRRLQRAGYVVYVAGSWADAIPALRERIDVCLLDVNLASLGGERICGLLKKGYRHLRVILFSSLDAVALGKLARDAGADGSISKSAPWTEVLKLLEGQIKLGRGAP
jgi:DNA-binding response OmpR family regulator